MTRAGVEDGRPPGVSPVLDRTFKVGLVLKAADGVPEIVAAALLVFISPSTLERLAHTVTAHELREDPHDRLANYILRTTAHLGSGTTLFGAIYLLGHGISKVILVALVLRNRLWAYPWLMGLLGGVYRLPAVCHGLRLVLVEPCRIDGLRRAAGLADLAGVPGATSRAACRGHGHWLLALLANRRCASRSAAFVRLPTWLFRR
jgi:uncharacterized membrane protein